jgi:hypothetical protein
MKRSLLIIAIGLAGGIAAQSLWFELRRPEEFSGSDKDIAWMRTELQLTGEQYARIRVLHEQSGPRILALAAQVSRMKDELEAFENTRRTGGQIDFLEFARFVDMRRSVDRACLDSTRRLVSDTAAVMTPEQRERYLSMIGQDPASNTRL